MGPDELSTSKYGMIITPINEDGTYGEPIEFGNCKFVKEEDLQDLDTTKKNKLIFNTAWSGEFNVKFRHKKISKKTFKKWCMSHGISRNAADYLCKALGWYCGRVRYQDIYYGSIFAPSFHTVFTNILIEGVKKPWMKNR